MANYIKFYDTVDIVITPIEVKDEQNVIHPDAPLIVKIAATHSGKITRNNGFYLPHKMHLGASSFTDQYPKPIQVHHSSDKDPIGRVLKAVYVDTSGESSSFFDYAVTDFVNGDLSLDDSFDLAIKLINNTTLADNKDYEGLGYIELTAEITDSDAIQKIRDKRYLTGSTGASTNKAICSVCKKDWADVGKCIHKPGQTYNNKKCVIIAGDLTYDEYSFVNKPADRHSRIIEICIGGIQDFLDLDKTEEVIISDKKSEEDVTMTFKDAFELASKQDRFRDWGSLVDNVKKIVEAHKDLTEDNLILLLSEIQDKEQIPLTVDTVDPEEQKLRDFYGNTYDEVVGEDNWGRDYAEMMFSLMEDATEETKDELKAFILDAKLSTSARKKLAGSSFCGPDRSFPVSDCCFTANTKIKMLNGTDKCIKDIQSGDWIYSFDIKTKAIVPAQVNKVWLAKKNALVLKITLDNGKEIFCTENHPFLTRDIEYKCASDLKQFDSLMPLYSKLGTMYSKKDGYEEIYQPWYGFWERTHVMVARECLGKTSNNDEIIHHIDEDITNNSPCNIACMTRSDHMKLHKKGNSSQSQKSISDFDRKIKSNFTKNRMERINSNLELKEKHAKLISEGRRTYNWDKPYEKINNTNYSLNDVVYARKAGVSLDFIAEKVGARSRTISNWVQKSVNDIFYKPNVLLIKEYFYSIYGVSVDQLHLELSIGSNYSKLSEKYQIDRETIRVWFAKAGLEVDRTKAVLDKNGGFIKHRTEWISGKTSSSSLSEQYNLKADTVVKRFKNSLTEMPYNHHVVSVEPFGTADVYDMEIPETHNFALSAGVFVHNSHYSAALRLLGRYKGPGDKDRIRACIERKGKRLGCGSKTVTDFVKPQADLFTIDYFDNFTDEEVLALEKALHDTLVERKLLKTVITEDSNNELDVLKKQIKYLYADIDNLTDAMADVIVQLKDSHIQQITNLKLLSKDTENLPDFVVELNDKTSEETKQILAELSKQVDIQKIVDTLSSGLSNTPSAHIEDPTLVADNLKSNETVEEIKKENKIEDKLKRLIVLQWRQKRIDDGDISADKWLNQIAQSYGCTIEDFKK